MKVYVYDVVYYSMYVDTLEPIRESKWAICLRKWVIKSTIRLQESRAGFYVDHLLQLSGRNPQISPIKFLRIPFQINTFISKQTPSSPNSPIQLL